MMAVVPLLKFAILKGEHWWKTIIYGGEERQKTSNFACSVFEISLLRGFKSTNNVPTCTPCSYLTCTGEVADHTY